MEDIRLGYMFVWDIKNDEKYIGYFIKCGI